MEEGGIKGESGAPVTTLSNFKLLRDGFSVENALKEINALNMWNWINLRRMFPGSCHNEVQDIVMRFAPVDRYQDFVSIMHNTETVSLMPWFVHRAVRALIHEAIPVRPDLLGRVVVSRVPPGGQIYPHPDGGLYAKHHDRVHIVLQSEEGNDFICDGETVWMKPGELWTFNHEKVHSVVNRSDSTRTHIIVDVKRGGAW